MGLRDWLRPRLLDWAMAQVDGLRPETIALAEGEVLEIGFGTGRNLDLYGPGVKRLVALDPNSSQGFGPADARVAGARFPIDRCGLPADGELPFPTHRFDTIVSTWTLCTIPDLPTALAELRRVLRAGGRFVFVEHGRAAGERAARWQDRIDPIWTRIADGCHMNRPMDRVVAESGFTLSSLEHFRHPAAPGLLAHMYRGVATAG